MSQYNVIRRELFRTQDIRVVAADYFMEPGIAPIEDLFTEHGIVVVSRGTFQCRTARHKVAFVPGSAMLANPGLSCEYTYDHSRGDRVVSFSYSPTAIEDVVRRIGQTSTRFQHMQLRPSARFEAIAQLLLGDDSTVTPEEWAYMLAAEVLTKPSDRRTSAAPASPTDRRRALDACALIEQRASQALSLVALATELDLSPFHFLRTFKRALGFTPHQYLVQTRLRHAAALLLETSKSIVEIAFAAGFSDLANFNRSFRHTMGCSPRQLRRERGGALANRSSSSKICKVS